MLQELQAVNHSKSILEKELQEVISVTTQELEDYREKVLELEDEVNTESFTWRLPDPRFNLVIPFHVVYSGTLHFTCV